MDVLRRLQNNFNPANIKPKTVSSKARQLTAQKANPIQPQNEQNRRPRDRRCGLDRRQFKRFVLLDLRSPYARRKSSRRDEETQDSGYGIDVFV